MNTSTTAKTLAWLAAASLTALANAQISNGSFETGNAYGVSNANLSIFNSGTPAPWFATSNTPDLYDNTGNDGWNLAGIPAYNGMFKGMLAHGGDRFIGFAAGNGFVPESFQQNLLPLTAGTQYQISAYIAADDLGKAAPFGGPYTGRGEIDVRINGSSVGMLTQNTATYTWELRSVTFTAPVAGSYSVEFVAQHDPTGAGASYIGMDDINATVVPEPASIIGLGVCLVGLARRRFRKS